ncbi:MAG: magnesium-protoporphyrin IX monomethyl ester anaerobic oxidative cyclase [Paracoccaceae bacterium]
MKLLLINPPHTAIGSRVPKEHLPPLGLLSIGGPLIDAGFDVSLLNADRENLELTDIADRVSQMNPDAVLIGHSGSTSAHPTIVVLTEMLRRNHPNLTIIYGGVFPTYHWDDVLRACPQIDVIVRGEGEETVCNLMCALRDNVDLSHIRGLAYHAPDGPKATPLAPMLQDLDAHRIGWELIDFKDYSYWGGKRAVILQFSRGCPHLCTYCGQRGFWTRWRHRDPVKFAQEIAWLVREHGIELINLADENPTSSRRMWRAFLEALIELDVNVLIVGSTRAGDIVRDADLMPLYKRAGVIRFLMGLEGTDQTTLATVRKGSDQTTDQTAIKLLRQHDMIGLCTFAIGFEEETDADYWRLLRSLLRYDPDQIMSVFATPHRWTPFFAASSHRKVIEPDLRRWDYKHQVLDCPNVPPLRIFLWVKLIEMTLQLRPKAIWRTYFHTNLDIRHAMRWYTRMGRGVVLREVLGFKGGRSRAKGQNVASFWGSTQGLPEDAMARVKLAKTASK